MTSAALSDDSRYTVTVAGATGKTGRLIVERALRRGWCVRAAARRRPPQGRWVRLEWDDPRSWEPAFSGSDAAYLLLPFNHPGAAEKTPRLLEAAARAGVPRLTLLTSWDASHAPEDGPLRTAERTLLGLPVQAAVLRPTWFLDNFVSGSFATMTSRGELRLPAGDARLPFVDVRDIADVALEALTPRGPRGVLEITGPEAIDHHRVAAALAAAFNRSITYRAVTVDEFIEDFVGQGFSPEYGRFLGDALQAAAQGTLRVPVSGTVQRVLGRSPHSVEDFARHHASTGPP